MFGKLLVIVLALVACGATVLALRHQRLETMHEITRLHEAIRAEEAATRTLRARIAEETTAERLREILAEVGLPWEPWPELSPSFRGGPDATLLVREPGADPAGDLPGAIDRGRNGAATAERTGRPLPPMWRVDWSPELLDDPASADAASEASRPRDTGPGPAAADDDADAGVPRP